MNAIPQSFLGRLVAAILLLNGILIGSVTPLNQSIPFGKTSGSSLQQRPDAETDPKAREILERHLKALGGRDRVTAIYAAKIIGKMEIAASDVEFDVQLYKHRGKYLLVMKVGQTEIRQGYNGQVVWESTPQDHRIIRGNERTAAINNNSRVFPAVAWLDGSYQGRIRYSGRTEVEDKRCHTLDFFPKNGVPVRRYFDPDTFLIRRYRTQQETDGEAVAIQVKDSDYRRVDGVLLPFKQQFAGDGQLFYTVRIDEVELNPQIPPQRFELPKEIQARLEKD